MRNILIPLMDAGSGHRKPAEAIGEAIERLYPGRFNVTIVDPGSEMGLLTDWYLKKSWDIALSYPFLADLGFFMVQLPISKYYLSTLFYFFKKKGAEYIYKSSPDIVFATHFFWLSIGVYSRKKYQTQNGVAGYLIDPHMLWQEKGVDKLYYDSRLLKGDKILRPLKKEQLQECSFPVHHKFSEIKKQDINKLRNKYNLLPDRVTLLTSQGGEGIGKIEKYIRALCKSDLSLNLLCVCGRNQKLKERIKRLSKRASSGINLMVFGYVENIEELVYISDTVLGKGGPSTTFEAMTLNKPMIYSHWVTYTEKPLIKYIVSQRAGWYTPSVKSFMDLMHDIVKTPDTLKKREAGCRKLSFRSGTDDIARMVVGCNSLD